MSKRFRSKEFVSELIKGKDPVTLSANLTGAGTDQIVGLNISSGPRVQMATSFIQSCTHVEGCEPRSVFTGNELFYGEYNFDPKIMEDCEVMAAIERRSTGDLADRHVVETKVFVKLRDSNEIKCYVIPSYASHHQHFGYKLFPNKDVDLTPGSFLKAGTILAHSPRIDENGEWCIGVNANTILASFIGVIEDAVIISSELADKLGTWGYKTVEFSWGERDYPLFLYGDSFMPEIGQTVNHDGILFAKRRYDPWHALNEMSRTGITEPCTRYDECICVPVGSVVVDIVALRDEIASTSMNSPSTISEVADRFVAGTSNHSADIRAFHKRYRATQPRNRVENYGGTAFSEVYNAIHADPTDLQIPDAAKEGAFLPKFKRMRGYVELDNYNFTVTVRYWMPMSVSDKISDIAGGKGVVAAVVPVDEMPIDEKGNRVHCIMSDNAMARRTNFNRGLEHYVNAARREGQDRLMKCLDTEGYDVAWDMLIDILGAATTKYVEEVQVALPDKEDRDEFLDYLRDNTLRIRLAQDDPLTGNDIITSLRELYPADPKKLLIDMGDGTKLWTEKDFVVGELTLIRLDKTGRDMAAIAMPRYQPFGTIAKMHTRDKNRSHGREHPGKFVDESVNRGIRAFTDHKLSVELIDIANNPVAGDALGRSALRAPVTGNIERSIDRKAIPYGRARPMEMIRHVFECGGIKLTDRREGELDD